MILPTPVLPSQIPSTQIRLYQLRYVCQHKDGSWRILEAIIKEFIDQTGRRSVVVNCRDVTERKRTEEIRGALEREKELSQLQLRFFSMASHEFRTPLSTILFSAQLLQNSHDECSKEKDAETSSGLKRLLKI
jgi:signal transduction histidine kinase